MNTRLLILFLLTIGSSHGQNKFGLLGGYNNSVLGKGFFEDTGSLGIFSGDNVGHSFHIGILYDIPINSDITFSPRIIFSEQGSKPQYSYNNALYVPTTYRLNYLNIPFEFKFFSKPSIIAGPQIGYLISSKKGQADYGDPKKFDYGLNVGLGYNFTSRFFSELKIYQGIQTVVNEPSGSDPPGPDRKLTNSVIQLSLGYYLN